MAKQRGLGKGLGALLGEEAKDNQGSVQEVDILQLDRHLNQPRKVFDDAKLQELAASIKEHGIVQPIIVREENGRYLIIAGERRYRAARIAGLKTVPVVIKNINDEQLMEISLIENIQREDLNVMEEANAISLLIREYGMTQEQVAQKIGRSRSAVANILRILKLPAPICEMLEKGELTEGHARCLVSLSVSEEKKIQLAQEIRDKGLSVRQAEQLAAMMDKKPKPKPIKRVMPPEFVEAQNRMTETLGTKVQIVGGRKRGKIVIEYYSSEQMDGLYELLTEK